MGLKLNRHVPSNLKNEFVAHVILNRMMEESPELKCEKILFIAGPPGTGKTSNTYALAEAMECNVHSVQGKDLVGQLEGASAAPLVDALKRAGNDTESFIPLVLIDDIDTGGLAHNPDISGTTSSEALKGCLMGWADSPKTVTVDDGMSSPRKVALPRPPAMVATTNRPDHVYPPILRPGRSKVITLDPREEDLRETLKVIFPHLQGLLVWNLQRKFQDQSIAFFVALKAEVAKETVIRWADMRCGSLRSEDWKLRARQFLSLSNGASYQELVAVGEKLLIQARNANFVRSAANSQDALNPLIGKEGFQNYGNGALRAAASDQPQPHIPPMKS